MWRPESHPFAWRAVESRSISPGNPDGRRGGVAPGPVDHYVKVEAGETFPLARIEGRGVIRSCWLTFASTPENLPDLLRSYVLRMFWDGADFPSVEVPLGDFFGLAHGRAAHFHTPHLSVVEGKGFNCFFPMPFAEGCRIELHNDSPFDQNMLYYQINYTLEPEIPSEWGRFHAHFRREITPEAGAPFVLLDTRGGPGVFVGMNASALPRSPGTWREGDFRFYFDGEEQASIVGTGWSDWFHSAWGLGIHQSAYAGSTYQVPHPEFGDKYFCSSYRFHPLDPIYFRSGLRLEHDPRGFAQFWEKKPRFDDWAGTVYWYQEKPVPLPPIPDRKERIRGLERQSWESQFPAIRTL